ncbi:MAG TPA: ATP12 family protein [Caulobacteraceae bacterium]|jgi:chaperone required for assembly of F1-ATPase
MRRFYSKAETAPADGGGFAVRLDGRPPRSPQGQPLVLPTVSLARLVAGEWAAQGENILPESMPATQLAWGALSLGEDDGVRAGAVARITAFAETDLVCYFADGPASLIELQERRWGAVIDWAEAALGVAFHRTQGVIHQPQPPATIARIEALAAAEDPFALAGLAAAAALFGSAILAFALRRGELTPEAAFELSRLDETFQEARWGVDAEAAARADAMAEDAVMLSAWFAALAG